MAKRKTVEIFIKLKDGVTGTLNKIKSGFGALGKSIASLAKVGAAAFAGLAAGAVALGSAIKKAFDFETAKIQLKTLLGSMEAANKRFKELRDFSAQTPFQLPDLLKASRLLTTFSEGALGSAESLKAIGDAAAGVNENIADVSFWVGRAYSMLKGGKPFGEAAMRLQEMGILTARGRQEMEDLQNQGASFTQVWSRLQRELERFEGGMEALSQTGNGLLSTLKDNWTIAVATFGEAFMDAAKGGIRTMIKEIQRLVDDGTIAEWANQAKAALDAVVATARILARGGEGREAVLRSMGNVLKQAFKSAALSAIELISKYAPTIGAAIGKGVLDLIGIERDPKHVREMRGDLAQAQLDQAAMIKSGADEKKIEAMGRLIEMLEAEIAKATKAWEEGRVEFEAVDLSGALKEFKKTLDTYNAAIDRPSHFKTGKALYDAVKKAMDKPLKKSVKEGTEEGTKKGIEDADRLKTTGTLTPSKISDGVGDRTLAGVSDMMKMLTRGQEAISKKSATIITGELVKRGFGGQMEDIMKIVEELRRGQDGLSLEQAMKDAIQILQSGAYTGDVDELLAIIKMLTRGQEQYGKGSMADIISGIYGGDANAMGGASVTTPAGDVSTETQTLDYLKQIAQNTKGGLF